MLILNYRIFSGSAEALLVRCGGKLQHLLIACFLGNMCAKHYENPIMFSRVTAKNVGDVFLRHTVDNYNEHYAKNDIRVLLMLSF